MTERQALEELVRELETFGRRIPLPTHLVRALKLAKRALAEEGSGG